MSDCPVCVYHASNVSRDTLKGFECFNCGGDLGKHDLKVSAAVEPSKAFAVNREQVERWPA